MTTNWKCPQNLSEQYRNLLATTKMINKCNEGTSKQHTTMDSTILVLGDAGVGKTTFVQFIAGDNSQLTSTETRNNSGKFLIHGNGIGSSDTEFCSLQPKQVISKFNTSITDTPGFSDIRSESNEVIAHLAMKKYLNDITDIKIILLVTYNSLEQEIYENDFVDLLKNIDDFIQNINEYKNSIILIATKVPNLYKTTGKTVALIDDDYVIAEIGEYIFRVEKSLEEKLNTTKENSKFLKNAITLLQSLQTVDGNEHFKRINLFRRPSLPGKLSELDEFQKSKKSIQETIYNTQYHTLSNNFNGYTLSYPTKTYLNCLQQYVNEILFQMSSNVFEEMESYSEINFGNKTDIYMEKMESERWLLKVEQLYRTLEEVHSYAEFLETIKKLIIEKHNGESDITYDNTLTEVQEFMNILESCQTYYQFPTATLVRQMMPMLNYAKEHHSWITFLVDLFKHFSSYHVQRKRIENVEANNQNNDTLNLLLSYMDASLYKIIKDKSKLFLNDSENIEEVEQIISITLREQNNYTCTADGGFIAQGYYIRISKINDCNVIRKLCNKPLTSMTIHAINTVFIDDDINDECFNGTKLVILAPRWEVIEARTINIYGNDGASHEKAAAKDGLFPGERGNDGMPGLPGGNGGHFLGIGAYFVNSKNLVVSIMGGNGGPGQHGGKGHQGQNGVDGEEMLDVGSNNYDAQYSIENGTDLFQTALDAHQNKTDASQNMVWYNTCGTKIILYMHHGSCGSKGGAGGHGGTAGIGGNSGTSIVIGENPKMPPMKIINTTGRNGEPGIGGNGGSTGERGKPITCIRTKLYLVQGRNVHYPNRVYKWQLVEQTGKDFWTCKNWYLSETTKCEGNKTGIHGMTGHIAANITKPPEAKKFDILTELSNPLILLTHYENNKYLRKDILQIRNVIENHLSNQKNKLWNRIFSSGINNFHEDEDEY